MRIQRPTITQIAEIKGDGAILTGSFSGSFTGEYNTAILSSSGQIADLGAGIISSSTQIDTDLFDIDGLVSGSIQIAGDISGSLGANATLVRSLTAAGVSGSLGANAALIRSLTAVGISGSLGANAALIRSLTATGVSGSLGANATLIRSLTATGVSGSLGANAALIRSLDAATISGSNNADSASASTRLTTAEAFKTSFDTAVGLSSDDVTILGNLTVQGTQTSLDTATLNVADKNITVASGSADSAAADGAGLTVGGAGATFTYTHSGTKWNVNKDLDLGSNNLITAGNVDGRDVSVDGTKLDTIEESADVTDETNVTAAGALMDSEVTNLADVKAFDTADYATAAQGTTADAALPKAGGAMTGAITTNSTFDGRDVATDGTKLDGIETGATADQTLADLSLDTTDDVQFDSFGVGTAASGTTGEIRATGDITAYYSSDERLKENFAPLTGALDKVKAIGGYEFDWKDGIEDVVSKTGHDIGVKAQELQAQYPELVHERDNGYLAVDYIKLNAVLIEAVKELAAKVEELSK